MKRNKFVRDNILSEEEFRQLMKACEQIDNSIANKYLVLAIMGGAVPGLRASEIAHIKETWVDQKILRNKINWEG